jgi:hypothetical protein
MKNCNLVLNDPNEEDWNKFINHFQDPDLLYFYIKQIYETKNVEKILTEVPDNKKDSVGSIYKLEVFRATMQYVEEFSMYLLAYIEDYENIGKKLVKTRTTKEVKEFFNYLNEGKEDEFSQKEKSMSFKELLMEVFGYSFFLKSEVYKESKTKFNKSIKESIEIIKNDLLNIAKYYSINLKLYNSIKHGTRIFPLIQNQLKSNKFTDNNPKNMIIAICKNDGENAAPYTLTLSVEYVIDNAFRIAGKTHSLFKYLRNITRNKLTKPNKMSISFFKSIPRDNTGKNYVTAVRNQNVMVIEVPDDFEVDNKPIINFNAFKIVLRGKKLFFHTKFEKETSLKYPFLVESSLSPSGDFTPSFYQHFKFNFDFYDLNVEQYLDLIKIHKLQEKGEIKSVNLVDDLNNKTIVKDNGNNIHFPAIPQLNDIKPIKLLCKLQKATGELIPFPRLTSKKQEQIIDENIDKNFSKKEAEEVVTNLKSKDSKQVYTIISTKILDFEGKEIFSRTFDPFPAEFFKLNFKTKNEENKFKEEIFEIPGKSIAILNWIGEIPHDIIEKIGLFVKGEIKELPEIEDVDMPLFELKTILSYAEPIFWYKEHFVTMIFKPINNFRLT